MATIPPNAAAIPVPMMMYRNKGSGVSSVENVFDDTLKFGGRHLFVQQVADEIGIGKLQKCLKRLLIRFGCLLVALLQVSQEKLVQLSQSTSALPLELRQ
jgi:hypothetical protein